MVHFICELLVRWDIHPVKSTSFKIQNVLASHNSVLKDWTDLFVQRAGQGETFLAGGKTSADPEPGKGLAFSRNRKGFHVAGLQGMKNRESRVGGGKPYRTYRLLCTFFILF